MQKVLNFGSLLQGYSLKCILEELGHDVSFIDIEKKPEEDILIKEYKKTFSDEYKIKKNKVDFYLIHKILHKIQDKKQQKLLIDFQKHEMDLNEYNNNKHYDYCVIGSDEVFNALNKSKWGFTSQLFGNVSQSDKVITYAASCGFTTFDGLPEKVKKIIRHSFGNISAFSVRDNNTESFVRQMGVDDIKTHYDPVVIADFSNETFNQKHIKNLPKKYCIVYAYHNRISDKNEIAKIKSFCKRKGLTLVSVGSSQFWIRRHLTISPFQIPEVFTKASFVITDTFHGTIFSAKYSKKFGVIVRKSNDNKLSDLLGKINIEKHRLNSINELDDIYETNNNFESMHKLEIRERKNAIRFFGENII